MKIKQIATIFVLATQLIPANAQVVFGNRGSTTPAPQTKPQAQTQTIPARTQPTLRPNPSVPSQLVVRQPTMSQTVNTTAKTPFEQNIDRQIEEVYRQRAQIPDAVNFDKLNSPRQCSPAEISKGKTSCGLCDEDTPHIVSDRRIGNGPYTLISDMDADYYRKNPYAAVKTTQTVTTGAPRRNGFIGGGNRNNGGITNFYLYTGYNLTGINKDFAPFNNRTVCETLRPDPNFKPTGDSNRDKFRGAKVLGLGVGGAALGTWMLNANGNMGKGTSMSSSAGGAAGGMSMSMPATESFACLEYYTGSNISPIGGDHVRMNMMHSQKCRQPMMNYYDIRMPEIYVYNVPVDGVANNCHAPSTIAARKMYLMTNPYIMYGQTMTESMRIVMQRPTTGGPTTSEGCGRVMQ